jgi:hypothetical protein
VQGCFWRGKRSCGLTLCREKTVVKTDSERVRWSGEPGAPRFAARTSSAVPLTSAAPVRSSAVLWGKCKATEARAVRSPAQVGRMG